MKCEHCGGSDFSDIETDTCYENGIDDPQYGGDITVIKYRECLLCGELRDENNR